MFSGSLPSVKHLPAAATTAADPTRRMRTTLEDTPLGVDVGTSWPGISFSCGMVAKQWGTSRAETAPPRPCDLKEFAMPEHDRPSTWRRLEVGRLLRGSLAEMFIKAYGAGAALSVALSDAETIRGQGWSTPSGQCPTWQRRYDQAKYAVDHREEIQAVDHLPQRAHPPRRTASVRPWGLR